jgi:quercetin dioxygenase-like cupin family protein
MNPNKGCDLSRLKQVKTTIINPVFKDTVTFLQTAASSSGRITQLEMTLQPSGGNPLHHHYYPEKFTALDGELGLRVGRKERKILQPAESFYVAPGALHAFFNPTDREIRFGVEVEPASERLESFLRVMYGLASDGLTDQNSKPKSFEHAAIVLCMGDVHVPGFLAVIRPLLQFAANRAKANGEEQRLIAKYCV